MNAQDIMTEDPVCCTPADTLTSVAKQFVACDCGLLPVVDSQESRRLVGVITDRDIVCRIVAQGRDCRESTVQEAMTTDRLWIAMPADSIDKVIESMEEGQVRRIPIVDAQQRVVGIVATADIALEVEDVEEVAEVFEDISQPSHIPHA